MNSNVLLVTIFLIALLICLLTVALFLRVLTKINSNSVLEIRELILVTNQTHRQAMAQQNDLLNKSLGLLATKEPLAFQAVQAVSQVLQTSASEPLSDEEEAKLWEENHDGPYPFSKDLDYDDIDLGPLEEIVRG